MKVKRAIPKTHKPRKNGWPQWKMDLLVKLRADPNLYNYDIAERLGCSTSTMSAKVKHLGLPPRKAGQRVGGTWWSRSSKKIKPIRERPDDGEDRTEKGYNRNITLVTSCADGTRIKVKVRDTGSYL